ncbi:MAG: hypothetical protein ACLT8E_03425 [Akkermansia sp.]
MLVELENLPEAGKKYSSELDSEIFGIDDEEVTSIGPLAFDLQVQSLKTNYSYGAIFPLRSESAACLA